jgi:hypothetical protein
MLSTSKPRARTLRDRDRGIGLEHLSISNAECDSSLGQVIGRHFQFDPVPGDDFDEVLAHLPADVGDHFSTDVEFDPEGGVRQSLFDSAFNFNCFFLGFLHV